MVAAVSPTASAKMSLDGEGQLSKQRSWATLVGPGCARSARGDRREHEWHVCRCDYDSENHLVMPKD